MATIGLKNLYYAKLTKDDLSGVTYESGTTKIAGLIEANIEPQTNSTTLYADDIPFATATTQGEINVTINVEDLPVEVHANLLGHTVKDGVMRIKGSDIAPYVAIMFESQKRDGSTRYIKLLKGKFKEVKMNPKTKAATPEFVTPQLEGTFISRQYDGMSMKMADSTSSGFTGAANWFSTVE